ncbi:MAG: GHMP kinase [Candidatus Rokuibacteriota bacterium]
MVDSPRFIITRTPMRVSFAGGGTDLADFYEHHYGAVFSTAIDKYIYVTVKRHGALFDEPVRVNYSRTEQVNTVAELQNEIARECLKFLEIDPPIYISTVADLPASTGLGGSSAFAVGLLNALHAFRGERVSAGTLAEEASHVEIDVLKQPIGKQDQYVSAFGGLNLFTFRPGGNVTVEPQRVRSELAQAMFDHMLLFFTGLRRDAKVVLTEQKARTAEKLDSLLAMREHALTLQALLGRGSFDPTEFGRILDVTWQLKRDLASTMTSGPIDAMYRDAMRAGAEGGKLCGAGGGGFLLFVVRPERQAAVRQALGRLSEVPVQYEVHGSRLLLPHS